MTGLFVSGLAADLVAFIEFKHALGVTFTGGEYHLRRLDGYCARHRVNRLTRDVVEGFVRECEADNPSPDRTGLSYLRSFARFLQARGDQDAHILSREFRPVRPRPTPYLLSAAEIEAFFEAAASCKYPDPWTWQAKAFFGLMLACGLRTGEVRQLDRNDVGFEAGTIDIHHSKGPRSRRLFIDDDVCRLLTICDRRNRTFAGDRQPFFVSGLGGPVTPSTPTRVFNHLWHAAGLTVPAIGTKPQPYAFRHHFAYANIERWTAQGQDPAAMLPYLARYIGHASTESTAYYLHVSPDFIAGYASSFAASAGLLPEAGFDD